MGSKPKILKENNPHNLTDQQVKFCKLYANGNLRGHGVQCYAEAYNRDLSKPGVYNTCKNNASRLLSSDNILTYIRELFEDKDLNDTVVDNELAYVIKQNADFGSKIAAIKEYNQLKARIIKKIELSNGGADEMVIKTKSKPVDENTKSDM